MPKDFSKNLKCSTTINKNIIDEFIKLTNHVAFEMDNELDQKNASVHGHRLRQIKNALKIIQNFPSEIKKGSDLENIKGIGKHTIQRIDEIIANGYLKDVNSSKENIQENKSMDELEDIIGVGRKKAKEFIKKHNIRSVEDLKKAHKNKTIVLNDKIILGLKYHNKVKQNIPRTEINNIDKYLHKILSGIDKELFGVICGSYRRKKATSNDIDLLITHPNVKTLAELKNHKINYLRKVVEKLKEEKFLLDDMTDKNFVNKYMGFSRFKKNPIRRMDIRYMPYGSYYPALLYFTGSGNFNKKMRLVAIKLGYKLNEYGLFKIKNDKAYRIKITSEKDIFDKLHMEYLNPEDRNVG